MIKDVLTKKFLKDYYIKKQLSTYEIANIVICGETTVHRALKFHNIPRRSNSESGKLCNHKRFKSNKNHIKHKKLLKILTKSYLIYHYVKLKESAYKISRTVNCDSSIIYEFLRNNNIKVRKSSETRDYKELARHLSKLFKGLYAGKNNPCWKGGMPKCVDCGKLLGNIYAKRCQPCNGNTRRGKNNHMFGKQIRANYGYYKDTWMRSSYELNFAKWCDLSNIKWLYESKTFDLGNCTYTPDFYLPEFDCHIEIKGYWRDDAKKKFTKFKKLYKKINIEIFNKEKLLNMSIIK